MQPIITLTQAITDVDLLGGPFVSPSFWTWKVIAKLIDGLPLVEPREIALFEACTGRKYNRQAIRAVRRLILLAGRRAGKDRFMSACAVWRSALAQDWNAHISAGEGAVVLLLGADKKQAQIVRRYCRGLLQTPGMQAEVTRDTGELVEFRNGGSLEIMTNDVRLVVGRSAIGVLGSECCKWKTGEAESSDEEVVSAAVPSMAMCPDNGPDDPGGLLILGSSVYRRRGLMYRKFKELHGSSSDSNEICWFATSQTMNPRLSQAVIDAALASDKLKACAEYLNQWREDVSDYVPLADVEGCTDWDAFERPPLPNVQYWAKFDAATGVPTGASFTMAVCHRENDDMVVLDVIRERKPPFVMRDVVAEFAMVLKSYNVSEIDGDQYARQIVGDEWIRNGIHLPEKSDTNTNKNYLRFLTMLMSRRAKLLNSSTLRSQLTSLERHVQSGHEEIRKPQVASARDDVAAAVAGAAVRAVAKRSLFGADAVWLNDGPEPDAKPSATENQNYAEMLERGATSGAAYERWLKQQDESAEAAEARARAAAKADAEAAAWRQRRYLLQNMNGGAMPGDRRAALFSHPSFRASLHRR
jgi:hypothetical protein